MLQLDGGQGWRRLSPGSHTDPCQLLLSLEAFSGPRTREGTLEGQSLMPGRSRRRAGAVPEGGTQASKRRDGQGALASASHRVPGTWKFPENMVET